MGTSINSGDVIGPYVIEKSLSQDGGMSQVFLAHDEQRPLYKAALTVQRTHNENRAAFQDLLRYESEVLQRLRHPGIVHIYPLHIDRVVTYAARAHIQEGKPWYFAMEYIQYNSLDTYIKKIRKYPLSWSLELFYQILLIVHYMHRIGYAHSDLKPSNIMFRTPPAPDQVPSPILVDFGSATQIQRGIKELSASLRYAPPEVILALERKDIPPHELIPKPRKVDIWALGAILFEIVTGRPLINKRSRKNITSTIVQGELDDLRSRRPEVHVSLDKLLSVMLSRQAERRPDTKTIIVAIEERIASTRPPRVSYRF